MKRLLMLVAFALVTTGCAGALDDATRTVNASQVVLRSTNEALGEAHRLRRDQALRAARGEAQARCLTEAVQASFAPAWDAYAEARLAWLAAHASVEAAKALQAAKAEPNLVRVAQAMLRSAKAWAALQEAADAVLATDPAAAPACAEGATP